MKWYFACNSASKEYIPLIKAAVLSAKANTTLDANFIYDGEADELTQWLENNDVNVIYHRSSLYPVLERKYSGNELKISSGAYLRCDIPLLEKDDDFVLYTDCDVIFLKDIKPQYPKYFSCSPEVDINDTKLFNTGVMFMNIKNLKKSHKAFSRFIKWNLWRLITWDQTAYQLFYKGKNTLLDLEFNHKPHWGVDEKASIIHFHGAKPTMFTNEKSAETMDYFNGLLYRKSPESYDYYLDLFKKYYPEIIYNENAIAKLKSGEYPISKPPKNSFTTRLKNFIRKNLLTE